MQSFRSGADAPIYPPAFPTESAIRELEAIAHLDLRPLSQERPIHGTRPL
jgi:hypothetical protein